MLFKDSVIIDAPPSRVWEYLASPDLWSLFHAKAGRCELVSRQRGRVGATYTMDFRMGNRTTPTRCEIVDLQPETRIEVSSTISDPEQPRASARIVYELKDLGLRTKVIEQCDITAPGLNVMLRAIIWLISRFGQPIGVTTLQKLKHIVEEK